MDKPDLRSALRPVLAAFRSLGIPYRIGGSLASTAFGVARATLDADLVVALEPQHAAQLVERLGQEFYLDATTVAEAIRDRSSFNLIHLASMLKIDIFVLKAGAYDRQSFARVMENPLDEEDEELQAVCFVTPEDIILRKLEWYRMGNEVLERQWADVIGVMRVQAAVLDLEYLRRWAHELGLSDLLEKGLAECAQEPGVA